MIKLKKWFYTNFSKGYDQKELDWLLISIISLVIIVSLIAISILATN